MQSRIRNAGIALLALAGVAASAWIAYDAWVRPGRDSTRTTVLSPDLPVVMRTPGGLLEVATLQVHERFTRSDTRDFWGIPLGTTVSTIEVPVRYRYHIELAKEWRISIRGKTAIVESPPLRPSLPVAFDTTGMRKYTQSGWARFNKDENLAALERSITPELDARARSERYLQLSTDSARQTIAEFVTQWLLREQHWRRDPEYTVKVSFPGEP